MTFGELRRVSPADAAAIQAVLATDPAAWQLLEGAPLSPTEGRDLFTSIPLGIAPETQTVLLGDGCVMAFLEGYPDALTRYLGLIFLAPSARGRGTGTALLHALAADAGARGFTALRLGCVTDNTAARRLYDRLGYRFIARRPRGAQLVDVLELALSPARA